MKTICRIAGRVAAVWLAAHSPSACAMTEAQLRAALRVPEDARVKIWPGVPDRTIVAWTAPHPDPSRKPDESRDMDSYDRTLMVVKTGTGEVTQKLFTENAYESDAIEFEGIAIDTANYALAPGHCAFGLRVATRHHGCAAFEGDRLELFDVQGDGLVQVLALPMQSHAEMCGGAGNDCTEHTRSDLTLAVAPTSTNGYADLVVHDKRDEAVDGKLVGGRCVPAARKSQRQVTLHFDGKGYAVPADLRP